MKLSKKLKRKLKKRLLVSVASISMVFLLFFVGRATEDPVFFKHLMTSGGYEQINGTTEYSGERLPNTDMVTYIYDANDLATFRDDVNNGDSYAGKTVYVMADIDMSTVCSETVGSWMPIGCDNEDGFAGTFDGNYHTIRNLYINDDSIAYVGLFNILPSTSIVQNVILKDVNILNTYSPVSNIYAGGITAYNNGTIINCGIESGSVVGRKTSVNTASNSYIGARVGGIVAYNYGTISGCYNKATIEAYSPISNAYNRVFAGGIVACNYKNLENCYNVGHVTGSAYSIFVGGVAGATQLSSGIDGYFRNCYNYGMVETDKKGSERCIGGIVARNGVNSTNYAMPITNSFTIDNVNYSYRYWNGSTLVTSTDGKVTADTLKTYTITLGSAFAYDAYNKNDGYPVLTWQNEIPVMNLDKNQAYIKVNEKLALNIIQDDKIGELIQNNYQSSNFKWMSSNEDVATVDENGMVTGITDGYTTIYAYHEQANLYAMTIINVAKEFANPQIGTGNGFTVILKADGTVWTVGNNKDGQLGNGTNDNSKIPQKVHMDENTELTHVIKIAVGTDHVLALTQEGKVYSWGLNSRGQLGSNDTTSSCYAKVVLGEDGTSDLQNIVDISAGANGSAAIDKAGNLYVWGKGTEGEIGNNIKDDSYLPTKNQVQNAIQVSMGTDSVSVLTAEGVAWSWGYNELGSLGINCTNNISYPMKVAHKVIGLSRNMRHSIIQKVDGTVYGAGTNARGRLGLKENNVFKSYTKINLPQTVTETNAVKYIHTGRVNTSLLLADGTIWETGRNDKGELGNGTTTETDGFVQGFIDKDIPLEGILTVGKNVGDASSTGSALNTAVITNNGNVYTTGDNSYGQMGDGTNTDSSYYKKMGSLHLVYEDETIYMDKTNREIELSKLKYVGNDFNVYEEKNISLGKIKYTSLNETMITVDENGNITAKQGATGSTKIKIEDITNGYETYVTVVMNNRLENTDTITYIYDANDLVAFRDSVNSGNDYTGKTVYVMADIDMSTVCSETVGSWEPIGNEATPFKGSFNGNYHTIEKIYIKENVTGDKLCYGLFGACQEATIANIQMKDGNITITGGNNIYVGAIGGYTGNGTTIMNCGNTVNITVQKSQRPFVGGIFGHSAPSMVIQRCYNKGTMSVSDSSSDSYVGGILGYNHQNILDCYNKGTISGYKANNSVKDISVGGIVGVQNPRGSLTRSYNTGLINGSDAYGSIVGYNYATITNSYFANTAPNKLIGVNNGGSSSNCASVEPETLKTYATTLGNAFTGDTINKNDGYPILKWELPQYKIVENQSYIKVGESATLTLEKNRFREDCQERPEDMEWSSSNQDVAIVDENGVVTGKGIGHTTITVYNRKIGIKAKAIINVYRNQEGAITVPQVEEGNGYTIILKEDGTVWATGLNNKGQLGDGTTENKNTPVQVKTDSDTYLTNIRKISTSHSHTIALTVDGEVYAWGNNKETAGSGWLGQGDTNNRVYATKVKGVNGEGYIGNIIDLVAGDRMSYVLHKDGIIYGAGFDVRFQISDTASDKLYLTKVTKIEDAIQITAGYCILGAITSNGETWVKGYNDYGEFGNGTKAEIGGISLVGTDINEFKLSDINFACVLKEDKTVWTTGNNNAGQLGLGDTTNRTTYTQMKFEDGSPVKAKRIVTKGNNIQLVSEDGKVYVTGYNGNGQLSNGTTTNAVYAVVMKDESGTEVTDAMSLIVGAMNDLNDNRFSSNVGIIREDGTVWIAGDNTYGQMGNGTNTGATYLTQMDAGFLRYPEETITLSVGDYQKIDKLLFERKENFSVFIKEASTSGDLTYEVEDEEIATVTSLGMIEGKKQGSTKVKVTDNVTKLSTDIQIKVLGIDLKEVMVNDREINPEETDKHQYRMDIKKLDTKAKIKVTTEDEEAEIRIGENEKELGTSEQWVDLDLEEDVIEIPVVVTLKKEERTITETYYILLTRQSNDTSAMVSYDGTPLTKAEDGKYKVSVLDTTTSGNIKVVTNQEKAKVDIGDTTQYEVGAKEYTVSMDVNTTQRTIEVPICIMAEDGTIENSIVEITRIETNANTEKVEGTYEVEGKAVTKEASLEEDGKYRIGIKETTTEVELKIIAESQYASITIGTETGKGKVTTKVMVEDEITYVNYQVTAEDGKTTIERTIELVKQSSETGIRNIVVEGKEVIADDNGIYQASVEGGSTGAKVVITAISNEAMIGISGIANPNTSQAILDTMVGINTIQNTYTITVTAEDGTVKVYTLKINKQTNIAGKIITENVEGKHIATVTVYKTSDTKPESKPFNDEVTILREVIARQETKEDGSYMVEVKDIEPYDIVISKLGYLDYRITEIEVQKGEKTELTPYNLMAGDVVKTGQIEIDDLVALNDNYGIVITESNRVQKAIYDLNEDGKVDDLDREILKKNYGKKNKIEQWEDPKRIRRMRTRRVETLPENPQNFILPIKGNYKITSDYGTRTHPVTGEVKKHTGIDLGGEHRTEIYAVADGEVVFAGVQKAFGNCIEIKHEVEGEIIYSFYAHLSRIDVKVGQEVRQEDVIGLEGGDPNTDPNPGSSTGHHLHFELRSKSGYGNDVDPRDYIQF